MRRRSTLDAWDGPRWKKKFNFEQLKMYFLFCIEYNDIYIK